MEIEIVRTRLKCYARLENNRGQQGSFRKTKPFVKVLPLPGGVIRAESCRIALSFWILPSDSTERPIKTSHWNAENMQGKAKMHEAEKYGACVESRETRDKAEACGYTTKQIVSNWENKLCTIWLVLIAGIERQGAEYRRRWIGPRTKKTIKNNLTRTAISSSLSGLQSSKNSFTSNLSSFLGIRAAVN